MNRGYIRAGAAIVVAAVLGAAPAVAANPSCRGADRPNGEISVNGNDGAKYEVMSASALSAVSPDGDVTFASFGFLYTTRGAGPYVQDGPPPGPIFHIKGTDVASIRSGISGLLKEVPDVNLSVAAKAVATRGWTLIVSPCARQ